MQIGDVVHGTPRSRVLLVYYGSRSWQRPEADRNGPDLRRDGEGGARRATL